MRCIACGAKTEYSTTADVTELGKCLIIIRNTPCHKCTECNEIMYKGDVVKSLEKVIKDAKQSLNEIAVFDYNTIVA